ncbi:hypothetical protein LP7551_04143 [Roseibium album]|nr:hypothetical protein LP7551_04143 [Roseibium album]
MNRTKDPVAQIDKMIDLMAELIELEDAVRQTRLHLEGVADRQFEAWVRESASAQRLMVLSST